MGAPYSRGGENCSNSASTASVGAEAALGHHHAGEDRKSARDLRWEERRRQYSARQANGCTSFAAGSAVEDEGGSVALKKHHPVAQQRMQQGEHEQEKSLQKKQERLHNPNGQMDTCTGTPRKESVIAQEGSILSSGATPPRPSQSGGGSETGSGGSSSVQGLPIRPASTPDKGEGLWLVQPRKGNSTCKSFC